MKMMYSWRMEVAKSAHDAIQIFEGYAYSVVLNRIELPGKMMIALMPVAQ